MRWGGLPISWILLAGCGAGPAPPAAKDQGSDADSDSNGDTDADSDVGSESGSGGSDSGSASDSDSSPGEEELDLGPDARPSDYPEADEWTNTENTLDADDPCCELVGEPIPLDASAAGRPPAIAVDWNAAEWGVAFTPLGFQAIDSLGNPIDIPNWTAAGFDHVRMTWGFDRYGAAIDDFRSDGQIVLLDREGDAVTDIVALDPDARLPDLAWHTHGQGWVVSYCDDAGRVGAVWMDADSALGEAASIGTGALSYRSRPLSVVALRSRAAVAWSTEGGVLFRSFAGREAADAPPEWEVSPQDSQVDAAAYRDSVALALADVNYASSLDVVLVDPWTDEIVAGPQTVTRDVFQANAAIVAAEERGFLGICHSSIMLDGAGGERIDVLLVGPDATSWGGSVLVREGLAHQRGCAIAWSGAEFLVVYVDDSGAPVAQRVRPLL